MRIYYAHPTSWYNTEAEALDVAELAKHGTVVNPNNLDFEYEVQLAKREKRPVMQIFADYINNYADVVAIRTFNDFKLGSGVARELLEALIWGKLVWKIRTTGTAPFRTVDKNPQLFGGFGSADIEFADVLTVAETKARIEKGQL